MAVALVIFARWNPLAAAAEAEHRVVLGEFADAVADLVLSVGNIAGQAKVGLLFIDFETPHRIRVQGHASLLRDDPLMSEYTEAKYLVKVDVTKIWVNCPRYIHKYKKLEQNKYVPRPDRETPLAAWKRLDLAGDVISDEDKARVAREGRLEVSEYEALVARGEA